MSDYTQFVATTPVVQPASPEVTYDKYWLSNFRIMAGDTTKPVRLIATFTPARDVTVDTPTTDENGDAILDGNGDPVTEEVTYKVLKPNAEPKRLVINNLFAEAEADPTGLGAVMNGVLGYLNTRATAEGII